MNEPEKNVRRKGLFRSKSSNISEAKKKSTGKDDWKNEVVCFNFYNLFNKLYCIVSCDICGLFCIRGLCCST